MNWRNIEDHLREYFRREDYSIHTVTGDTVAQQENYDDDTGSAFVSEINLTELAMHLAREMEHAA